MITCLVADDHPGVVSALTELLGEAGFEISGTARNGIHTVALAAVKQPSCAVVDYRMPGLPGAELLVRLHEVAPGTGLVVYTAELSADLADEALAVGAAGIVLKESPLADVLRALEAALSGSTYLDPALVSVARLSPASHLTTREAEVLALVADGLSYEQIGRRLGIGVETARTHLKKACVRLGAATRTQAVATALRLGWIH